MKLSVSLSEDDVRFIDEYQSRSRAGRVGGSAGIDVVVPNRSAVIQHALRLLRESSLQDEYEAAFEEWEAAEEAAWDRAAGDGLGAGDARAPR